MCDSYVHSRRMLPSATEFRVGNVESIDSDGCSSPRGGCCRPVITAWPSRAASLTLSFLLKISKNPMDLTDWSYLPKSKGLLVLVVLVV